MSIQKLVTRYRGKYILLTFGILVAIYLFSWLPWLVLRETDNIVTSIEQVAQHDVAIIFGGLHEEGDELSETNRERLLAGAKLLQENKVSGLVVSNTAAAANDMRDFLLNNGVLENQIEIDTTAVVTEDSCVTEHNQHPEGRTVIFVSHGYHLPRIVFACERLGVPGQAIAAENVISLEREPLSMLHTARIRFMRVQRESILSLLNILGLYGPTLEKEF